MCTCANGLRIRFEILARALPLRAMDKLPALPRIVFLGTPDFAVASLKALLDHGYPVVAVVTAPDKPSGRGMQVKGSAVKEFALAHDLPLLQPHKLKDPDFLDALRAYKADLQVVVAFRMLPELVWDMPKWGTINVHASLLPDYRGAAPINWAIINGEKETGVSTFKLLHEIDTGNLLLQQKVAIGERDDFGSLYHKLMAEGADLLVETLRQWSKGVLVERAQVKAGDAKHAPKIFKEDCRIDWSKSAKEIYDFIRGLSPHPAAFTFLENKQLRIFESTYEACDTGKMPGDIVSDGKKTLKFAAADGWVHCEVVQYEGKKKMPVAEFLKGYRPG